MSVSLTTARGEDLERDRSPPKGSRHSGRQKEREREREREREAEEIDR